MRRGVQAQPIPYMFSSYHKGEQQFAMHDLLKKAKDIVSRYWIPVFVTTQRSMCCKQMSLK
jgi:hypothetical protein